MTITAQSIIQDCVTLAQDVTSVRWTIDEVCRYFNWAQREVVVYRPDANQTRGNIAIIAGYKQSLPAGASKLIDIHANAAGSAMRIANREILDAQKSNWRTISAANPVHFMYDPRTPLSFEIYPPASGATTVDCSYSVVPTSISIATVGGTYANVSGNLGVQDQFAGAVTDLILYRMYMKDAEYAGNAAIAQGYLASALNTLGVEIKGTVSISPTSPATPTHPGSSRAIA